MKTYFSMAVTILAVLLLSSGGLLVTHAATPSSVSSSTSQALSLNMMGGVVSAGNQNYLIVQKGPALEAVIDGSPLVTSQLTYTLNAQQKGLTTSGSASFTLTGQNLTGATVTVTGKVQISGSVPAVALPAGCVTNCTSEVPAAFTGAASIQVGPAQTSTSSNAQATTTVGMVLESAYFDPFGDAITITSVDNSIIIATNYTKASITWTNVVDAGILMGSLGSTPISGAFQQVAAEQENLVKGTAIDAGTMSFLGVTNMTSGAQIALMNANGGYLGTSIIPHAGSFSCGIACTETGFQDSGSFLLYGSQGKSSAVITGSYSTTWTVPAFGFSSTANGNIAQFSGIAGAFAGRVSI
ncbi:MAG: hypothetical protein ABSE82_12405 [Nitrososphaerales archaeon]|jgi:hypothetical protein